jgi:hypothetical protein
VAVADFAEDCLGGVWYLTTSRQLWRVDTPGGLAYQLDASFAITAISEVLGPGGWTLRARRLDGTLDYFTAP